jgi:hypothetical protein
MQRETHKADSHTTSPVAWPVVRTDDESSSRVVPMSEPYRVTPHQTQPRKVGRTSVPQSGEQTSEAPTKESSPSKEKEERTGTRRRRQGGFHGPLEATSVTLPKVPYDFTLDMANSLSPSCSAAVVFDSVVVTRHVTAEQLIEVRNTIVSSGEGEMEEAGSRERVAEEAGTEMSDKKRVDSEGDNEEDDEGSEDASMKGPS